ncbi:MAG: DNA-binding protein Alba [Candidatus Heimdallarchaeota archaeon]|nr:DNA-binding protein Alba [Candidatus Heimdallarchaeota archaeon]
MSKDAKKPKSKKTDEKAKTKETPKAKTTATPKTETKAKESAPKTTKPKTEQPAKVETDFKPENTIFVGNKQPITYVLAVMTCFNEKKAKEVKICARGRAISSAVDVAELTKNRFMPDVKVKKITTSTEQVTRREGGGEANVSAIEIILAK